jgi:hypothetical protein
MTLSIIEKTCSKCKKSKSISFFQTETRNNKKRVISWCKECKNSYTKEYYERTKTRRAELRKIRYNKDDKSALKIWLKKRKEIGTPQWVQSKWQSLSNNAKKRNIEFSLKFSDIREIYLDYSGNCPICNEPFKKPSVDRVNNTKGYISGNCRLICYGCNAAKNCISPKQLKLIYLYVFGNKKPSEI